MTEERQEVLFLAVIVTALILFMAWFSSKTDANFDRVRSEMEELQHDENPQGSVPITEFVPTTTG